MDLESFVNFAKRFQNVEAGISLAAGVTVGLLLGYKLAAQRERERAEEEIRSVCRVYKKAYLKLSAEKDALQAQKEDVQEDEAEEYSDILHERGYSEENREEEVLATKSNVFDNPTPPHEAIGMSLEDWNHRERRQNDGSPYVITEEEFSVGYDNYDRVTLTFFEEDDTLCDDREQVVPDLEYVIGEDNLTEFGKYSGNKDVVFVRNDELETDYEVLRESGSYLEEVLGIREDYSHLSSGEFDE